MLISIQPKLPSYFAIDIERIAVYICEAEGIMEIADIPIDLGYDYLESDWDDWVQQVYPWFCLVHKEEQPEIYKTLWDAFIKFVDKENTIMYGNT